MPRHSSAVCPEYAKSFTLPLDENIFVQGQCRCVGFIVENAFLSSGEQGLVTTDDSPLLSVVIRQGPREDMSVLLPTRSTGCRAEGKMLSVRNAISL